MTNGWIDIKNTDMMLIMGGNPAENHPCGFKWPIEAKLHRNAKMIVVDPRFTRTAATADLFLQIRAGADIAFLGGLINYAIQNNRIAKDYLTNYTNAAFVVKEGFKLPEDGLFSGFDGHSNYEKETWNYEAGGNVGPTNEGQGTAGAMAQQGPAASSTSPSGKGKSAAGGVMDSTTGGGHQAAGGPGAAGQGGTKPPPMLPANVAYDLSLQHERSVFQLL
jgi:anaerobic selenocysteine-containing dehydrogenase